MKVSYHEQEHEGVGPHEEQGDPDSGKVQVEQADPLVDSTWLAVAAAEGGYNFHTPPQNRG